MQQQQRESGREERIRLTDEMLELCHHILALNALDRVCEHLTSQDRIGRIALPVPSTFGCAAQRAGYWAKLIIDALVAVLIAHGSALGICKTTVPSRCNVDARRESRDLIRKADTERTVLETHGTEAKTRDGPSLSYTPFQLPSGTYEEKARSAWCLRRYVEWYHSVSYQLSD
jgi:hypothetical protein